MKDFKEKLKPNIILATYIIVLSYVLLNFEKVWKLLSSGLGILAPFIGAIGIAFVLNIPMTLIEKFILFPLESRKYEKFKKLKRPLAIILTLILIIGLLITLMVFVIPQLVKSMSTLTESIPRYLNSFEHMIDQNLSSIPGADKLINDILSMWKDVLQFASEFLGVAVSHVLDFTISVTSGIVTFFLALIFSIYMLANKEKLSLTLKKFIYAHLKIRFADKLLEIGSLSNDIFSKFIGGQCLEGCIIGTLCTIGMLILGLPYALLIGVIIGVTSLIPIFGAFIGTIPAMFIIFMIKPIEALIFLAFILALQQVEGHFIYPRVVGNSVGLSPIWVMLAMLVGGSLFGLLGFLLGIPAFSVIYRLIRENTNKKLAKKNIKID